MIDILLTVVPSILWLIYRCIKLFQVPVDEIISDLNIDIPHIPNICVDSVTSTSILIHWDIQLHYDENLYYILLVNNKEVSTLTSRSCKLSDLTKDTLYQIQIIAVNISTNYRSVSNSVYVETLSKERVPLDSIKQRYNNSFAGDSSGKGQLKSSSKELNLDDSLTNGFVDGFVDDLDIDISSIKQIRDENLLYKYLKHYQIQLVKLFDEFKAAEENIGLEFEKLQHQNAKLVQDSKSQTSTINKNSMILKEKQKRKEDLLLHKSKLNSKVLEVKKSIDHKYKNVNSLKMDISKLTSKKAYIQSHGETDKAKLFSKIDSTVEDIRGLKLNQQMIEDNLKSVKTKRKQLSKLHNTIHELSVKFNDSCFNKDHSLNEKGLEILNDLYKIKPEWSKAIEGEKGNLNDFDQAFKSALMNGLKGYTNTYNSLETVKSTSEKNYSPSWISEASAANKFGCSNYHPGKLYKNRNRSNSKGFRNVSMGAGSSPSSKSTSPAPNNLNPNMTMTNSIDSQVQIQSGNLSGQNLSGQNLSGQNLSGQNLSGQNLSGQNLSGQNLSGQNLSGQNLSGQNSSGSGTGTPLATGVSDSNSFNNFYGDIYNEDDDKLNPPSYDSVFRVNVTPSDSPSLGGAPSLPGRAPSLTSGAPLAAAPLGTPTLPGAPMNGNMANGHYFNESPNISNVNLPVPNAYLSGLNSPNLQAQHLQHSQSQPPMQQMNLNQVQPQIQQQLQPPQQLQQLNMGSPQAETPHLENGLFEDGILNHPNLSNSSLGSSRFSSKLWNGNSLNHTRSISGSNIWVNNGFGNGNIDDFRPFDQFGMNSMNMSNLNLNMNMNNINMNMQNNLNLNNLNGAPLNSPPLNQPLNNPLNNPPLFDTFPRSPTTSSPPNMSFLNQFGIPGMNQGQNVQTQQNQQNQQTIRGQDLPQLPGQDLHLPLERNDYQEHQEEVKQNSLNSL